MRAGENRGHIRVVRGRSGQSLIRLSVCIVTFQNRDCIGDCLRSLRAASQRSGDVNLETIVVDNASADGTAERVRSEFPEVQLVARRANSGFAAANNEALRRATGEFLLLLNPDTVAPSGALEQMARFMADRPELGVVGCRLAGPDGSVQHSVRAFPTFRSALYQFTACRYAGLFRKAYDAYRRKRFDYARTSECDSVMGAAFLTRRDMTDAIGFLDERYFMYYEEVDFCKRVKDAGRTVCFFADATVTHLGGQSAHHERRLVHVSRMRSLMRYFGRHRGRGATTLYKLVFVPLALMRALLELPGALVRAGAYRFCRPDAYRAGKSWAQFKLRLAFLIKDWVRVAAA